MGVTPAHQLPEPFNDTYWMAKALSLAQRAAELGEVPVGALIVHNNDCIGAGYNQPISLCDPTAHAEIIALRQAANTVGNYRLPRPTTLYATLEPCVMCAGALLQARVTRVVFGAGDSRNGGCGSAFNILQTQGLNHRAEIQSGVLAQDSQQLLHAFFRARR